MGLEWRGAELPFSARDTVLWERAEQEIEAHRCGDVIMRVVDANGQPLRGVPVRYNQRVHAFHFGAQYPYDSETYDLLQQAGINAATLWLGWKYVEPEAGIYNWEYLDRVWHPALLHKRGLRLTAHALNWFKPGWNVLPQYLLDTPVTELPDLVYKHVGQIARHWAPYIETFELVNEPFWTDADALTLGLEDMVRICHATAVAVRDVVPDARLEINFAEASRKLSYRLSPLDFLEQLERANVPYDSIGLQAFENGYSVTDPPTFYRTKTFTGILQTLQQYAKAGKSIDISALAMPSVPPCSKPPSRFELRYGLWDETAQARYLDAAYTLFFAHRAVEGITWWCPVDGRLSFIQGGGLLREDLSPKPSYTALKQWMQRHTSSGQVYSDAEGRAVIRGYGGDYEITVGAGTLGRPMTHHIDPRVATEVTVVLDRNR